jgi:hypothetical protein
MAQKEATYIIPKKYKLSVKEVLMSTILSILLFFIIPVGSAQAKSTYNLSIASIFQDEARFLSEWIDYHHMLGVEHFYLYNHNSKDNYKEVLLPYIEEGIVDLIEYSSEDFPQKKMMADAIHKTKNISTWVIFIDTDEFVFPKNHDSIQELLLDYEPYAGLAINWENFGTSYVKEIPQGELMIDHLILQGHKQNIQNKFVKCIVRPECVEKILTEHGFTYKGDAFAVSPNFTTYSDKFRAPFQNDVVIINHYWSRDETFFYDVKVPRCQRVKKWTKKGSEKYAEQFNAIRETAIIARFSEALKNYRKERKWVKAV